MQTVTFQILTGVEQGRVLELSIPVTIGREEENSLRLSDERVSRYHVKIQEDQGRVILVDLDSTNGTRVNGLPVQMRILYPGDMIAIGRSVLVYGSPNEIPLHSLSNPNMDHSTQSAAISEDDLSVLQTAQTADEYFPHGPPELPTNMRPLQSAQLSDVLTYLHERLAQFIESATEKGEVAEDRSMILPQPQWQRVLQLELTIARYLKTLGNPGED